MILLFLRLAVLYIHCDSCKDCFYVVEGVVESACNMNRNKCNLVPILNLVSNGCT